MTEKAIPAAEEEVVAICRDLIRIDTTNPGDHSGPGERKAAEYVAGLLGEVGVAPAVLAPHPKRTSLVARIEGQDRTRPALLIHGHLDVVPANASDWRQDPFGGEIAADCGPARTASRPVTSCSPSPRTKRRAATGAPSSSLSSTRTCSRVSPRR